MMCVAADAIFVLEESSNTGTKTRTESEVGSPKTHSARALMAPDQLPPGPLSSPCFSPLSQPSLGLQSLSKLAFGARDSLGAAKAPHGAGTARSHNQGN